ncbi:MAG TPA: bifunctional oligoribonuclease/PAP phosphatase NrnA [Solirubrobacterales bacterium]
MSGVPMTAVTERDAALAEAVAAIRDEDRFLLTAHEGPDGDALGSLLAMHAILEQLGKDSVMFLASKEFPLPIEYRFLPLEEVFHEAPADLADRTIVFLDCGNIDRMPVDWLRNREERILNIDHHHDNTRFGSVNLVDVAASSTAEIVFELAGLLGAQITHEIADALYVGLVTDTGRFMYDNTDARAHRMAADLIEAGVNVHDIYRRLFERVPVEKLRLVSRALEKLERYPDCGLAITYIEESDYEATGSSEALTEGIIDYVRSIEGTAVAVFVRDKTDGGRAARKVSLRATEGVDVSAIAREHGGGGHRRAAGFSTDLEYEELVELLCDRVRSQMQSSGAG